MKKVAAKHHFPATLDLDEWIRFGLQQADPGWRLLALKEILVGGGAPDLFALVKSIAQDDPDGECRLSAEAILAAERSRRKLRLFLARNLPLTPDSLRPYRSELTADLRQLLVRKFRLKPDSSILEDWRAHLFGETAPEIIQLGLSLLARYGRTGDWAYAQFFFGSGQTEVEMAALEVLFRHDRERFLEKVAVALAGGDAERQMHALRLLRQIDPAESLEYLKPLLNDPRPINRQAALREMLLIPFELTQSVFLQFLGAETHPFLVLEAGIGIASNPQPELPEKLFEICWDATGLKASVLQLVVNHALEGIRAAGVLRKPVEDYLQELKETLAVKRALRLKTQALTDLYDPDPEWRLSAVEHLQELSADREVRQALARRRTEETYEDILAALTLPLESELPPVEPTTSSSLDRTGNGGTAPGEQIRRWVAPQGETPPVLEPVPTTDEALPGGPATARPAGGVPATGSRGRHTPGVDTCGVQTPPPGDPSGREAPRRAGSALVALPDTHTSCVQSLAPADGRPAGGSPPPGDPSGREAPSLAPAGGSPPPGDPSAAVPLQAGSPPPTPGPVTASGSGLAAIIDGPSLRRNHSLIRDALAKPPSRLVLLEAIHKLGRFGDRGDGRLLLPLLDNQEPPVLAAAIKALGRLDIDLLAPLLGKFLQSENARLKAAALEAFLRFDKKSALQNLQAMGRALVPNLRRRALSILPLVDFPSAEPLLIEMFTRETVPELKQQIGVLLASNPSGPGLSCLFAGTHDAEGKPQPDWKEFWQTTLTAAAPVLGQDPGLLDETLRREFLAAEAKKRLPPPAYAYRRVMGSQGPPAPPAPTFAGLLSDFRNRPWAAFSVGMLCFPALAWLWLWISPPGSVPGDGITASQVAETVFSGNPPPGSLVPLRLLTPRTRGKDSRRVRRSLKRIPFVEPAPPLK